jgi:hypothetical protein
VNAIEIVKQGGTGTALAYLMLTAPTEWLAAMPVIPESHYLPMVGALGAVITAGLRLAGLGKTVVQPVVPEA